MSAPSTTFPTGFPEPLLSGFGLRPEQNIIETQFDSGLSRRRPRHTRTPLVADISYNLPLSKAQELLNFYIGPACGGGAYFNYAINFKEGNQNFVARFLSEPQIRSVDGTFEVSFTLELQGTAPLLLDTVF